MLNFSNNSSTSLHLSNVYMYLACMQTRWPQKNSQNLPSSSETMTSSVFWSYASCFWQLLLSSASLFKVTSYVLLMSLSICKRFRLFVALSNILHNLCQDVSYLTCIAFFLQVYVHIDTSGKITEAAVVMLTTGLVFGARHRRGIWWISVSTARCSVSRWSRLHQWTRTRYRPTRRTSHQQSAAARPPLTPGWVSP